MCKINWIQSNNYIQWQQSYQFIMLVYNFLMIFFLSAGEIPPKKLQALQKVLQSEFCNAIREASVVWFSSVLQSFQNTSWK